MADLSDVERALNLAIGAALYPEGARGKLASPVAGVPVRVECGWPDQQELTDTVAGDKWCIVSVYSPPGVERNTTRYPDTWTETPAQPATYTLTTLGQTVSLGGQGATYPQNLCLFANGRPYVVTANAQTPAALAAALAVLISADVPGVAVQGAALTLPPSAWLGPVRVGTQGTASKEVRRVERSIQVIVWAPSPEARVAVVNAFDPVLADTPFLPLADESQARLRYLRSADSDFDQRQGLYRRDLFYSVEFPTTRTISAAQIVAAEVVTTNTAGATLADTWS